MAKPVRRSAPPRRSGGRFLLGVFIGILLGLGIALAVAFYLNKTPLPFLGKSRPSDAPVPPQKPIAGMPQGGAKGPERDKPKFDFYKILPGGEEPKVQAAKPVLPDRTTAEKAAGKVGPEKVAEKAPEKTAEKSEKPR